MVGSDVAVARLFFRCKEELLELELELDLECDDSRNSRSWITIGMSNRCTRVIGKSFRCFLSLVRRGSWIESAETGLSGGLGFGDVGDRALPSNMYGWASIEIAESLDLRVRWRNMERFAGAGRACSTAIIVENIGMR